MELCSSLTARFVPLALAAALLIPPSPAAALEPPAPRPGAFQGHFSLLELEARPSLERQERGSAKAAAAPELSRFFAHHSDQWEVRWDRRSRRPNLVEGVGIPLLPDKAMTLAEVESKVRAFLADFPELLRVEGLDLRLDPARSVNVGGQKQLWLVERQQFHDGVPVEGATVFFRVNNGNLIQFGAHRVAEVRVPADARLTREEAFQAVLDKAGFAASEIAEIVQPGALAFHPVLPPGERPAERYTGPAGQGYRHVLAWEVIFRRQGDEATYQALVDARNGRVLRLQDANDYWFAPIDGGIYPNNNTNAETSQPFPYADITDNNFGVVTSNGMGYYNYGGMGSTCTLNGRYTRISDVCGAISLPSNMDGTLDFGTSAGTDCTTPGFGGAGNTHAARNAFFHLTWQNRKAIGYLPANAWLANKLTATTNVIDTCNAVWNGSSVRFYRSGGGCSNSGELSSVIIHEWGHGMDQNTGGAAPLEKASGEAVGDTFAFLYNQDACIGHNFRPGVPCQNCGACTGVRNIAPFALGGTATIAKPANVASDTGINCDAWSCPYSTPGGTAYRGPMGYEGHCESYIASTANWDLVKNLDARWGAGSKKFDQLWYASLTATKSAYQVTAGGQCNPAASVDGCAADNWYTVLLAVDDNDGNLANGTPNGCRIWDAYNAHGIACGARPACTS